MTKHRGFTIVVIFLCFGLVAHAEPKSNEQWIEYFLDQISGIRVEISRLETDGVVEEWRRDQAIEEKIDHLTRSVEKLTELVDEQRVLIEELRSSTSN